MRQNYPIERKNLTIPKLELMACVLLNQLIFSVYSSLKFNYKEMKFLCWTDSLDFLFWIHNTKIIWKQFIQTRVLKIRDTLEGRSWLFGPGVQNIADICTRGPYLKDDDIMAGGTSVSTIVSGRLAKHKKCRKI